MRGKVLFTKKNEKGIYGFISCDDGSSPYFDTSGIIKGNYLKAGLDVEFDVIPSRKGKTQAINIKIASDRIAYDILSQEKVEVLMELLEESFLESSFIDCARLPDLLKKVSVNYKDYAEDIKTFVDKYLYTSYSTKKAYTHENKVYPRVLVPNKGVDINADLSKAIVESFSAIIENNGFLTAEKIPGVLKELGIDNYRDFAGTMDHFVEKYCEGLFVPKKRIKIRGKLYPKIYIFRDNDDLYQEEDSLSSTSYSRVMLNQDSILAIKSVLIESLEDKDYLIGGSVPELFEKAGVEDYKKYARSLEEFITVYLSDTVEMKKNEICNGKCEPSIVVLKNNEVTNKSLKKLYDDGDSKSFLSSTFLRNVNPLTLGVEGIQMALFMLADYLGENRDVVTINAFHEVLITTETAYDLKQYKDDSRLLELGAQTAYLPFSTDEFLKIFANIHNGKKNFNNNWNGIAERFWTAKSTLAVYLSCLIMIITKKDVGIDNYLGEALNERKIDKLPIILKIYTDFLRNGNNNISVRLKRKIIGHCLDCHDINTLCNSYQFFDNCTLPEMEDVIEFLKGTKSIDYNILMSWFHSDIGEMIAEKITNYYWWRESSGQLCDELVKTLASVLWEYRENYFSAIVYNDSCPGFRKEQKEQILVENFNKLCETAKEYKKAFLLVNYIYKNYIASLESTIFDNTWNELKGWMKKQVESQMTLELSTACVIRLFRYDVDTTGELEDYYCNTYVADALKMISSDDELDVYISKCGELNLPFVAQWVVNNKEHSAVKDKERYVRSLIETRRIDEAIACIQVEHDFPESQKLKLIKEALCENFELYTFSSAAYRIFDSSIPERFAERILLHNINFADAYAIESLICIYAYRKEWAKVLYLYIPFRAIHEDGHRQFIADFNEFLTSERILKKNNRIDSHFDVIKCALKIYDSNEFDSFIEWAKKIKVPSSSKKYNCKPKTFDNTIKEMLGERNYNEVWRQLLLSALRTDNNEKQDSLRFCIITSYIGRFGLASFENEVLSLSKNKLASKNYNEYYISLWKGLLTGNYSLNFLRLSRALIGNAPPTYWNIFYDVSVCKNHVFSTADFELKNWRDMDHQIQLFYDEILNRYSVTRESVYIKIAASILSECGGNISPSFEYYAPYCNSNRNKDFLFAALINLIVEGHCLNDISKFLKADFWRVEEEESRLIQILQSICTEEYDDLFGDVSLTLDEKCSFKSDFLECVKNYPKVMVPKTVRESSCECRLTYQYKLMEWLLKVGGDRGKVNERSRVLASIVPTIKDDIINDSDYLSYIQFVSVLYKNQLKLGFDDLVYVRNRYYRLLVIGALMETDIELFSDDEIVMLMQRNKHFASIFPEYKEFKKYILDFINLDSISDKLKTIFLLGVISNNWEQFSKLGPTYDENSLRLINSIESYTNYRDFNSQILKEYIYNSSPKEQKNIEYVELCSPKMYMVLKEIKRIYDEDNSNYDICRDLLIGIAYLDAPDKAGKAYENMNRYLENYIDVLNQHWDMYVFTLLSTSYIKTIINILSQDIRKRKISTAAVIRWRPVFASMNELSTFYYLLAIKYAIERNVKDAKQALFSIPLLSDLPVEWLEEKSRLELYLSGEAKYFNPGEINAIDTLSVEKEATNVSFIQNFSQHQSNATITTGNNGGVNAYRSILQSESDMEDIFKYNLYRQLFAYVKSAEDLYEIYRQIDNQRQSKNRARLTYNELVIEYGSLMITYNDQLSSDQKMDVLLEIFDIYQLLNDMNKSKANIINRLICAEQSVIETPGVSFEKWLLCKNNISQIFNHEIIAYPEKEINRWLKPIEECFVIVENNDTEMAILESLSQWRNNYNLLSDCSDCENAFVRAVDEKIQRLKNGINLSLTINNVDIEDNSVFYQIKNISPYNNVSIRLDNSLQNSARLQALIKINNCEFERFDGCFSNELELRSNDTCGQVYRLPVKVLESLHEGDMLTIILNVIYDERKICNNINQCHFRYVKYESVLTPDLIPNAVHYGTAVPAFSATIKGFGREKEKADLRDLLEQNLAIIYGPSRAGKSSLLNYLANDYLREYADFSGYSSFMRIRVADEQNTKNDYIQDMITGESLQPFESSTQIMEYLFFSPLKVAFGDSSDIKKHRMCKVIGDAFPEVAKQEINLVLSQQGSVVDKYGVISQILSEHHCQIWIMYDEFQQIVERWVGNADELAELCTSIKYNQTSIKLVLCGSDELVRIFECEHDMDWAEFKVRTSDNLVFVGQLSDLDFGAMMNDRAIWRSVSENYPWNFVDESMVLPAALQSLYEYTGGNAICGKLFGEELLKKLKDGYFANRKYIYPADITHIAYEVLSSEASQIKNLLITHTTKNLKNEEPYLLYIAHELASDINISEVSFRKICGFFVTKESTEVEAALKLLVARGILKTNKGSRKYRFATLYYFDCYKNQATDLVISKLKSMMDDIMLKEPSKEIQPNIMDIMQLYDALTPQEKYRILSMVYADESLPEKSMDEFKRRIANNYGDVIGTQNNNNIQINAQAINTAFTTLLTPGVTVDTLLEAFHSLPHMTSYLLDEQVAEVKQLSSDLVNASDDEKEAIIEKIEDITIPAEQRLVGDTLCAVLDSDDLEGVDEGEWRNLLGKGTDVEGLQKLPAEYLDLLKFAIMIHGVFEKIRNAMPKDKQNELDYCPVAIMYCKLVENMLKRKHTPLYIERLGEKTLKPGGNKFSSLGTPEKFNYRHKDLAIGSFSFHLVNAHINVYSPIKSTFSFDEKNGNDYEMNINALAFGDDDLKDIWMVHAQSLAYVHQIRNKSAHEALPISKKIFDLLIRELFHNGELLRIYDLSK